jgi:NAD(P) transhydrogenase subunit alpha
VIKHGVKIIGVANLPATVAADASALYARNVLAFLSLMIDAKSGEFKIDKDDEVIAGTLVCDAGRVVGR